MFEPGSIVCYGTAHTETHLVVKVKELPRDGVEFIWTLRLDTRPWYLGCFPVDWFHTHSPE